MSIEKFKKSEWKIENEKTCEKNVDNGPESDGSEGPLEAVVSDQNT